MPYKDPDKQREWQRDYQRRKRAGIPTKIKVPLTPEERIDRARASSIRAYMKKFKLINSVWGESCFFCPRTKVRIMHRKDGTEHKPLNELSYKKLYYIIDKEKDEYVRLCGICHKGVHWCMKHLRLTWEDIVYMNI